MKTIILILLLWIILFGFLYLIINGSFKKRKRLNKNTVFDVMENSVKNESSYSKKINKIFDNTIGLDKKFNSKQKTEFFNICCQEIEHKKDLA